MMGEVKLLQYVSKRVLKQSGIADLLRRSRTLWVCCALLFPDAGSNGLLPKGAF